MTFTRETLEDFEGREEWMGFGYLGGFGWRSQETDEILIAAANEAGITEEDFFEFCNSKPGRKLDQIFEGVWEIPFPSDGTTEEKDNWLENKNNERGEWTNYWPVQEDEEGVLWGMDDDEQDRNFIPIITTHPVHKDLHAKLVEFLPEICKELKEEY